MSQPEPPVHMGLSEMLEQTEWYRNPFTRWFRVADLSPGERLTASERLLKFALPMAKEVFKDLYAYGRPSGEQAQMDLERGEAAVEAIMSSAESAREWMSQTPLCAALRGEKPYETWEPLEEPPRTPYEVKEASRRDALASLDEEILRLEQVENQVGITLKALREVRSSIL